MGSPCQLWPIGVYLHSSAGAHSIAVGLPLGTAWQTYASSTTKMLTNLLKAGQPTRALSSLLPPAQSPASTNPKGRRKKEQLLANSALPWAGATDPCVPIFKLPKSTHMSRGCSHALTNHLVFHLLSPKPLCLPLKTFNLMSDCYILSLVHM